MSQKIGACNLSIPMHQYSRKRSMDLRASNFLDTPKMWFADILLLHTSFETLRTKMRIGHAACFLNFALEVPWSPRILIIQWSLNRSKSSMTPSSSLTRTRTTGSPWRPVWIENFEVSVFVSSWISDLCAPGIRHFIELPWTEPHWAGTSRVDRWGWWAWCFAYWLPHLSIADVAEVKGNWFLDLK